MELSKIYGFCLSVMVILFAIQTIMICQKTIIMIAPLQAGQCDYGVFKYDGKGIRYVQSMSFNFENKKTPKTSTVVAPPAPQKEVK